MLTEINSDEVRYLRGVRVSTLFLIIATGLVACNQDSETCPEFWNLERNQVSAYAKIDSSELVLEVWNPTSPDALVLGQGKLAGDFNVSVSLLEFEWDSLIVPQFRLEVYEPNNEQNKISGIAVNDVAYYCYSGVGPNKRDMRLIPYSTGSVSIRRAENIITCFANIGGVELSYSDTLVSDDLHVRMVLGTSENGTGLVTAKLDDFQIDEPNSDNTSEVFSDDFDCQSW